ncbi:exodeoxyribonuclease VII large subunit [Henriciella barbarensis]|uniref:Exodeoxyribonuclease 7 large subunit n=1 Tax=Henriciella barbarensis TaxID=86342 RepID=A0A399QUI0_9PROT|nr:exodeoxyribonuclease VII large subunit [Henriciella barbarensis]RIJ22121.1 exodeoxyribonuclease VII large subunit [Henriciella barbarensis]
MSEPPPSNVVELSVSELAGALKRTIETTYDHVRVRGELGRVTIARSGHMYADIKDDKAVLNSVMWKGSVQRLPFKPEEGLEVVAEGRLSIYAGRSNYQLIADFMRPAGAGALMALLEERKKKLAAAGLFDDRHKKPLPFLPRTVGVVTSPTGAVIRDILHRIRERFPVRVILWPALVQGDRAAAQIEAGIRGFNAMPESDRPDVLIVGRGGGSIEDLWPFNEENVVRSAFESAIPLISAVGHETDTTLIDFVSDARAPTPTGAAEIAVPVRADLMMAIDERAQSLTRALSRRVRHDADRLRASRLPRLETLIAQKRQSLDYLDAGLRGGLSGAIKSKHIELARTGSRLRTDPLSKDARDARRRLLDTAKRARPALERLIDTRKQRLSAGANLLEALSYQATLARGFAVVRDAKDTILRSSKAISAGDHLSITLHDGTVGANVAESDAGPARRTEVAAPKPKAPSTAPAKPAKEPPQGDLF